MILKENYTLHNGVEIPKIGLGTWFINNKNVVPAVLDAVKAGYRHIDTAQAYRNEAGVGEGVRKSGVRRDELFVTTKLDAGVKSYKKAVSAIDKSLQRMKLDYIDMMIIHSPQPWTKFRTDDPYFEGNLEAWKALEEAYKAGKLRAIGVSNFEERDLNNLIVNGTVKPMVNQVLAHIGKTPIELIAFGEKHNILTEAYSPIAHGQLLEHTQVLEIANRYGVSVAQLSIRYLIQLGLLPLPKTTKLNHMKNNADVDFVIAEADMNTLRNVEEITDYGDASMMPVYGGKLNLKSMFKMIVQSMKS